MSSTAPETQQFRCSQGRQMLRARRLRPPKGLECGRAGDASGRAIPAEALLQLRSRPAGHAQPGRCLHPQLEAGDGSLHPAALALVPARTHQQRRRPRAEPRFYKHGIFYILHNDEDGDGEGEARSLPVGRYSRCRWWAASGSWHGERRWTRPKPQPSRHRRRTNPLALLLDANAEGGRLADRGSSTACRHLLFLAKFLRVRLIGQRLSGGRPSVLSLGQGSSASKACQTRRTVRPWRPARLRQGCSDREALVIRAVRAAVGPGPMLDDLLRRVALLLMAHCWSSGPGRSREELPAPPATSTLSLVPVAKAQSLSDADPTPDPGPLRLRQRPAAPAARSAMTLPLEVRSATATPRKRRSAPAASATGGGTPADKPCRCAESRRELNRLSAAAALASSGDSSDVPRDMRSRIPAAGCSPCRTAQAQEGRAGLSLRCKSGGMTGRPAWQPFSKASSPAITPLSCSSPPPRSPRASPLPSPLPSPRFRVDKASAAIKGSVTATGDADKRESSRPSTPSRSVQVQVLYETARPSQGGQVSPQQQPAATGIHGDIVDLSPLPGQRHAETQTPTPVAFDEAQSPCYSSMRKQILTVRNVITDLQQKISHLGEEASQREALAERNMRSVEFWQKRYEELKMQYEDLQVAHHKCPRNRKFGT